jgi:glycosyltransferase involved in cell wall biosynthesis
VTAIHQLLPVFTPGDAIGGAVTATQQMLGELGYQSDIYADIIDHRLAGAARPAAALHDTMRAADTVLYHLSVGSRLAAVFWSLPGHKVVVYHNITPPEYFYPTNPAVALQLIAGRRQLHDLSARAELCIADSDYNAAEARGCGYRRVVVIPPPVDLTRLQPVAASPVAPLYALFVGRFAINKRHDTLIRSLAILAAEGVDLRLVLVGPADDNRAYVKALRSLADRLGVQDRVDIHAGRVSDGRLRELYRGASLFATASEHEGFCVPIVEAMAFHLPVVARAAAAVPATVDGAGLLVEGDDPLLMAAAIHRVIRDEPLRRHLTAAGQVRLEPFGRDDIKAGLAAALTGAGIETRTDRWPRRPEAGVPLRG